MKLRPFQLVCFALLLCTLSLADSSALAQGVVPLQASYLGALLFPDYESGSRRSEKAKPIPERRKAFVRSAPAALPPAELATLATAWSMRPPSAHTAALQSVSGFGSPSA